MRLTLDNKQVLLGTGSQSWAQMPTDDRAIVLVHGAGFDHSVWTGPARFFARRLQAQGVRVIAPDLPAHGASEGPALESVEAMAQWLHTLLQSLGISRVSVAGHSLGSLVAYEFAACYPQMCQQLVLLGTSNPMPVGGVLLGAAQDDHPAAFTMANTWSHIRAGGLGASANPGMSNFLGDERLLQRNLTGVYGADLQACNNYQPSATPLEVPTLLLAARQDKMTPARAGMKAVADFRQVEQVVLEDCGHAMLNEKPNEVLDALAEFMLPAFQGSNEG